MDILEHERRAVRLLEEAKGHTWVFEFDEAHKKISEAQKHLCKMESILHDESSEE